MSAGIAAGTWLLGGAILGSAVIGSEGAKAGAQAGADSATAAAQLSWDQYVQSRQDLSPYREVAVGKEIYGNRAAYDDKLAAWQAENPDYSFSPFDRSGRPPPRPGNYDEVTGYTGGALNTLSEYGPSQVDEANYIPPSAIPEFDSTQFDIYKDPSYEWRAGEQERGINRNMAGMGKVTSGNRLEEIMKRSGEMASQEYSAAHGRMVDDYNIRRANEATGYARGVDSYGRAVGREGDYLNRLASLSNIGQTATTSGAGYGATSAANTGNAMIAAGQAQAAGRVGQANAWSGMFGDLTSLYAMNKYGGSPYTNYGGMAADVNNMYQYSGLY